MDSSLGPQASALMAGLTGWDWFILLCTLFSLLMGLWRGLIQTAFGLASWVVGFFGAAWLWALVRPMVPPLPSAVPNWVPLVVAFFVLLVLVRLAGKLVLRGARAIGLTGTDRLLGGIAGLVRAGLIVMVVAVAAFRLGFAADPAWQQARLRVLLDGMVEWSTPLLPPPGQPETLLRDKIRQSFLWYRTAPA